MKTCRSLIVFLQVISTEHQSTPGASRCSVDSKHTPMVRALLPVYALKHIYLKKKKALSERRQRAADDRLAHAHSRWRNGITDQVKFVNYARTAVQTDGKKKWRHLKTVSALMRMIDVCVSVLSSADALLQSHSDGESQRSNMEREDTRSSPSTPSTPSVCSPTSTTSSVPSTGKNLCASCGLEILDRYLLKVRGRPYFQTFCFPFYINRQKQFVCTRQSGANEVGCCADSALIFGFGRPAISLHGI